MIDEQLNHVAGKHTRDLLKGEANISFKDLIGQELPTYLWDYMNIILNPHLGGVTRIGNLELDFRDDKVIEGLERQLMEDLVIEENELSRIVRQALDTRFNFILDPAGTLAKTVFSRQSEDSISSAQADILIAALIKVIQHWNPRITKAIDVVTQFLRQHPDMPQSAVELERQLRSAIEKDFTQNPLPSIEASLLILKDLLSPAIEYEGAESLDLSEHIGAILSNRGLMAWTPAIEVEREILDKPLDIDVALKAMSRLRLYRERGLLAADTAAIKAVDEELENFTSFIEGVS